MPEFNKLRFNEDLLGRLMVSKRETFNISNNQNDKLLIQSTVLPDITFNSCTDWLNTIKENNRILEESKIEYEKNKEVMNDNIKYMHSWLDLKFKIY